LRLDSCHHLYGNGVGRNHGHARQPFLQERVIVISLSSLSRAGGGDAYLVDFQDTCVNFPTYDLVYMFARFGRVNSAPGMMKIRIT